MAHTLGIDFGTSNSAAGYVRDGKPHLVTMAPGQTTLPTTVFFDYDARNMLMGHPANDALLDGIEGRFMRALKRVLGTSIMHEKRQLLNERMTFVDIIARFLAEVKKRAEAEAGHVFDHALSGRPVVFHGAGDPREAQAEADLRACYLAAGFKDVSFLPEPEAAAIASGALDHPGATGLIVDIGGGTSDFSIFRTGNDGVTILANHGVRIGGTDFDRSISIDRVMPLFGAGTLIRNAMGPGTLPAPKGIFNDLATWEKIPFLYTAKTRRMVSDMVQLAEERDKMGRLGTVLEHELGHDVAFAVEQGKIDANSGRYDAVIALDQVTSGLTAALPVASLRCILDPHAAALRLGVAETLNMARTEAGQIDQVIYVGGSSLMSMVTDTMRERFPDARHSFSEVFTAVADGLALAADRHDASAVA
ncbi:molecular chaperone DnaK [Tateyamaria omphalii]|uniref:Hsp70 family protein n=1 Tax=Tateyamaria omphalii TaxID=299262 RepID=UPI0016789EC5|nr:Hsp70 family protein [Tateyamaria omphalii]GGX58247.1 molecular chaperone DnaK [Tateyamaria omphalii]